MIAGYSKNKHMNWYQIRFPSFYFLMNYAAWNQGFAIHRASKSNVNGLVNECLGSGLRYTKLASRKLHGVVVT